MSTIESCNAFDYMVGTFWRFSCTCLLFRTTAHLTFITPPLVLLNSTIILNSTFNSTNTLIWIEISGGTSPHAEGFYTQVRTPPRPPPPSPQCPSCSPHPDPQDGEVEVAFFGVEMTLGEKIACLQPPPPSVDTVGGSGACGWWRRAGALALLASLLDSPHVARPAPHLSMHTRRRSCHTRHHIPLRPLPAQGSGAQVYFDPASSLAYLLWTSSEAES